MSSVTYFTYKGILFPTVEYAAEDLAYLENEFQVLDDDTITLSYPKSGTHWMLEILGLIQHNGDPTWVRSSPVVERSPWIEIVPGLKTALKYPPPRLLACHLPVQLFPKSFLQSKAKVIYVIRNPKDVLISLFYFTRIIKIWKESGTLEEYLQTFFSGNLPYGSWFDHVKGWMALKDRPNFFFITYEEMHQDLRGCVEKVCHFLGKELNKQQIDSVVENASFQKMRENKMCNGSLLPHHILDKKKGQLLRKGICEDWKNHLTPKQEELFDRVYQEKMRDMSVAFPWD
ncbi:sulfotransferase 2B1-like [Eublepharis macularius]|uniref:Sulfotransferase n=1 Tax=Eublepharis macularius TaxID=481883 RepID=A0AA97LKV1_EUBMA|nr:sulfotransferase 2B1-like [Eublepharis macularius]